ncbi:hypothetical protein GCM10023144_25870 [Pigmentiphaga soli]|uniref:4Fe-4S Mo/W bis-MGD-type domain-containing protein n=1 Tax=Pigmentiphaga soli TaxID=1007095 RepID=A0ABP8H3Y4_9BURK
MADRIPGFCALCRSRCGSVGVVENGVLLAQEPDPSHPTGKALCMKGRAAPEIVANPQRLLYPVRRTAPKGSQDPGWRRISWDEALDETAAQLNRIKAAHGAEAVAFSITSPSGSPLSDGIKWVERLVNAFGSPNLSRGTEICNWHKDEAHAYTFGRGIGSPDFEHTGCVLLWGHNPSATWLDHATGVNDAVRRGAKLVVVDPRRVGFAMRADQWLRVRPGSDGALALGIAGEMIRNGWFDADFLREHSNGPLLVRGDTGRLLREGDLSGQPGGARLVAWNEARGAFACYDPATGLYEGGPEGIALRAVRTVAIDGVEVECRSAFQRYADLCDDYPPDRVAQICWVNADAVTQTARLLFHHRPVSYYAWSGVGQHTNATQTDRAIALLYALTGDFDAQGGNVEFSHLPARDVGGRELMPAGQLAKCISAQAQPLGPARKGAIGSDALYRAILQEEPYAIRALVGFGANLVMSHANPQAARQALSKLEFCVHADVTLTPTAQFADIVLPVNTPWEREALRVGFEVSQAAEELVQLRPAMIPSAGESRSDAWIVFELAKRMGLGEHFWNGDIDAAYRYILEPTGISLEVLRQQPEGMRQPLAPAYRKYARQPRGFATPSGKVEVYSETFLGAGQDPLPGYVEPVPRLIADAAVKQAFPLVLTSAKLPQFCHSQHRQIPSLRRKSPEPVVTLHPETAAGRGIANGDWVALSTPSGTVRMKAAFDTHLDQRVVCAQYGWWQGSQELGLAGYEPFSTDGANFNLLIGDGELDPISGSAPHRSYVCNVRPLEGKSA